MDCCPGMMWFRRGVVVAGLVAVAGVLLHHAIAQEFKSGIVWPVPPVVQPGEGSQPPSDATVLFDGTSLDAWKGGEQWVIEDGVATAQGGGITTKDSFGDCQLHLEFATPAEVSGTGQGRGNSGVYLMGRYEIQILDSYENDTYPDGQAAALYKQQPPMVNASRKPGEWQTYEILFNGPRFDDEGNLTRAGQVTVLHNGVCVHHATEIQGSTAWDRPPLYSQHPERLPISLQFHGNPVRFRNIWLRDLEPLVGELPAEKVGG